MTDCLFCRIIAGDIPATKVFEDDNILAFNDINPVSPHHILIIPKKHIATLGDSKDSDKELLGELLVIARKIASELNISDYRVVINNGKDVGQTVFHIHLHLLSGRFFSWPPG